MSRQPNQQQSYPNPGGHMYHPDPHHAGAHASSPSVFQQHAQAHGGYYDGRVYEQHAPGSSGGGSGSAVPYGYAGGPAPGPGSAPNGSLRSPLPHIASRDPYGGYPPASIHVPRASPGGHTSSTPRGPGSEAWSSFHPSALPPMPSLRQQESRSNVSVKLEDLVSHDRGAGSWPGKGPGGFTSMPLGVGLPESGAPGTGPGPSRISSGTSGPAPPSSTAVGGAEPPVQAGPSDFIKKLYKMLEEESAQYGRAKNAPGSDAPRGSVGWGRGGTSFVVWDMNEFTTKVLPQTFRHSNFSSFVRQLNKYGFSKVNHGPARNSILGWFELKMQIKHVDDDTGQIKENIWEFQHPNFVAGGKADLDFIKRKAVASKKTEAETETSPAARPAFALSGEDHARMAELELRVRGLEDRLASALEDVRQARNREHGTLGLMREMLSHLSAVERGAAASSAGTPQSDTEPSPRMLQMWQMFEQLVSGVPALPQPPFGYGEYQPPPHTYPAYVLPPHIGNPSLAQVSPQTDGSRRSGSNAPPASRSSVATGSTANRIAPGTAGMPDEGEVQDGGPIASSQHLQPQPHSHQHNFPNQTPTQEQLPTAHTHVDSSLPSAPPGFAETPAWLTEGVSVPMPMYHRKSSDGTAIRLMMEALAANHNGNVGMNNTDFAMMEGQDPLDPSPPTSQQPSSSDSHQADQGVGLLPHHSASAKQNPARLAAPIIQSSPFGTVLIPSDSSVHPNAQKQGQPGKAGEKGHLAQSAGGPLAFSQRQTTDANGNAVRTRRSTVIKPHWNKTPTILVVEDDVVYRQLSSRFLEKFGCVVETVENATEAIAKMNTTKYDLVLMDIFFGPSMDGRKATSLIRQFDMYTPIISMTSNAQPQDVDSYLQSGMNDILAKPFTKHGLFGILDKHLLHMKSLQLSAEVPRGVGVPPLSDQGVLQAIATGAASASTNGQMDWDDPDLKNPLAAMGWSDDTYQIVLSQYLQTGSMPDINSIDFSQGQSMITYTLQSGTTGIQQGTMNANGQNGLHVPANIASVLPNANGLAGGGGTIGPNMVFGDFNTRKRSLETATDDGWSPVQETGRIEEISGSEAAGTGGVGAARQEAKKVKR